MKFAGIYIYITWQYNGFLVLMVVRCTLWCWASLSWHISISQFISCSCQRIGISMRLNTGTYFSFVYFNSLIYFFTLIHFLILSKFQCAGLHVRRKGIIIRAEIISSNWFLVRAKASSDVITSLNLQVDIPPLFLCSNYYRYYIHTPNYTNKTFIITQLCIVFNWINITLFGSRRVLNERILLRFFFA